MTALGILTAWLALSTAFTWAWSRAQPVKTDEERYLDDEAQMRALQRQERNA